MKKNRFKFTAAQIWGLTLMVSMDIGVWALAGYFWLNYFFGGK